MVKRKKHLGYKYNHTPTTLLISVFGGACAFIAVESTFPAIMDSFGNQMYRPTGWQLHMGSACVGIVASCIFLFTLEALETKSRATAWRSSAPWLPLVGLTALATAIHIPLYIVLLVGAIYGSWAYRRTCGVRGSPRLP